jgi:hypothetical protein
MDMGCSLKGSTASLIAYWDSFHIYIIYDFSLLSQIVYKHKLDFAKYCKSPFRMH